MLKATAQTIVKAALATLRDEGFAGATSRAIARRGDFNQALIFYHFGSLESLLPAMADLWDEDKAAGHVQIVAQLVAGSINRPELSQQVVELMEPWIRL